MMALHKSPRFEVIPLVQQFYKVSPIAIFGNAIWRTLLKTNFIPSAYTPYITRKPYSVERGPGAIRGTKDKPRSTTPKSSPSSLMTGTLPSWWRLLSNNLRENNGMGNDLFVDAAESASFPLPGTGKREGDEKTQPLQCFTSHLGILGPNSIEKNQLKNRLKNHLRFHFDSMTCLNHPLLTFFTVGNLSWFFKWVFSLIFSQFLFY